MKKYRLIIFAFAFLFAGNSCSNFLEVNPKQVLDDALLTKPSDMEGFVTAAYARITDIPSWDSPFSPWWSGSLRSDDSYKGGGGTWDGGNGWGYMETFVNLTPNVVCLLPDNTTMQYCNSKNGKYLRRRLSIKKC